MDFGIFIPPVAGSWRLVKRAEELGFQRAWFYDTQMLNSELFAIMGAAADTPNVVSSCFTRSASSMTVSFLTASTISATAAMTASLSDEICSCALRKRDSRSGQAFMPAWKDPLFQAPFVSLMAYAGLILAMSADGGIVEGRRSIAGSITSERKK